MVEKTIKCEDGTTKTLLISEEESTNTNSENGEEVSTLNIISVVVAAILGIMVGGYILWISLLKYVFMWIKNDPCEAVCVWAFLMFLSYLWRWTGKVYPMEDEE